MDKQEILTDLSNKILCEHHRPGDPLIERDLCERYQISRTPMREILWSLVEKGLVIQQRGRGFSVRRMDANQLREVFEARQGLEGFAARLCCRKCTAAEVARFEQLNRNLQELSEEQLCNEGIALGRSMHRLIIETGDNALLNEMYGKVNNLVSLTSNMTRRVIGIEVESRLAHIGIIDAILSGDEEASERRMREHIHSTYCALLNTLHPGAAEAFTDSGATHRQTREPAPERRV